jgi:hypothetical protein
VARFPSTSEALGLIPNTAPQRELDLLLAQSQDAVIGYKTE